MTLTLDVDQEIEERLSKVAAAAGKSPKQYAETALLERLASERVAVDERVEAQSRAERERELDRNIEAIQQGSGSLGRNGRPWRELTHEGHKY